MASKFQLAVSPSAIAGLGLFTQERIPEGRVAVEFIHGTCMPASDFTPPFVGFPTDAIIHGKGGTVYVDTAYASSEVVPCWYRLNHSSIPNLCARARSSTIRFVSLGPIPAGSELTIHYGVPDPAWQ